MSLPEIKADRKSGYSRAIMAHLHVRWDRHTEKFVPMGGISTELWNLLSVFLDSGIPGCLFVDPPGEMVLGGVRLVKPSMWHVEPIEPPHDSLPGQFGALNLSIMDISG